MVGFSHDIFRTRHLFGSSLIVSVLLAMLLRWPSLYVYEQNLEGGDEAVADIGFHPPKRSPPSPPPRRAPLKYWTETMLPATPISVTVARAVGESVAGDTFQFGLDRPKPISRGGGGGTQQTLKS